MVMNFYSFKIQCWAFFFLLNINLLFFTLEYLYKISMVLLMCLVFFDNNLN